MSFSRPDPGLTKRQICAELRKLGWVRTHRGWQKRHRPGKNYVRSGVFSVREAASFELLDACESLS